MQRHSSARKTKNTGRLLEPMPPNIIIISELPDAHSFKALRDIAGWGEVNLDQARLALINSLFGVSAFSGGQLIGMARIIGDGVINAYIQDVVIAPDYRGQGIGKAVMQTLIADMRHILPTDCTIGLMAATGQEGFYKSFRFIPRPNTDYGAGMFAKLANLTDGTNS